VRGRRCGPGSACLGNVMLALLAHRTLRWLERQRVRYYLARMNVGERVSIKEGLRVARPENVTIGSDVRINSDVLLQAHGPIDIGDFTMLASRCAIVTATHDMAKRGIEAFDTLTKAPVRIGRHCWLGVGVTVLPGVTIGDGTVVGAGSVVTHDLPPGMICAGVPAKPMRQRPSQPQGSGPA